MNVNNFIAISRDGDVYFSLPTEWKELSAVLTDPCCWVASTSKDKASIQPDAIVVVTRPLGETIVAPNIECLAHGINNSRLLYFQGNANGPLASLLASFRVNVDPNLGIEAHVDRRTGLGFLHFHSDDVVKWAVWAISKPDEYVKFLNDADITWYDTDRNEIEGGVIEVPRNLDSLVLTSEAPRPGTTPGCGKSGLIRQTNGAYTLSWLSAIRW